MPPGKPTKTLEPGCDRAASRDGSRRVANRRNPTLSAITATPTSCFWSNKLSAAFSDNESPSDAEHDQASAKKAAGRGRKSASYTDANPEEEEDDAVSTDDKNGDVGAEDEEAGDEDDDMDEEVYGQQENASELVQRSLTPALGMWWRRSCRT
jgi:hypothetical protein